MKRPKKVRGLIEDRGLVYIRKFVNGAMFKKSFGRAEDPEVWATAKAELHKIEEQIRLGRFKQEDKTTRVLVPQAIDLFLSKQPASSWAGQMPPLKTFFASTYLDELTYLKLDAYRQWRLTQTIKRRNPETGILFDKPIERSSVNRELTGLSSMISSMRLWAEEREIKPIDLPSVNLFKVYRKKIGWHDERLNRRTRILSNQECADFIEKYATPGVAKAAEMALNTVLRKKDLFALEQKNRTEEDLRGEQSKVGALYVVPMNANIRLAFDEKDGPLLDDTNFRKEWEASRARFMAAGNEYFQWKDLRRTALRKIWEETRDILLCRDVAGHKDVKTTQLYLGLTERDIAQAGAVLERNFTFKTTRWEKGAA